MKKLIAASLTLALLTGPAALAGGGANTTIAGIVASDPNFSTLLQAVQAAGLAETLSGSGSFTVFAPTNAAFAKVPAAQLQALLNDPAALRRVLLYHVVPGHVTAAQVVRLRSARTSQGSNVTIAVNGSRVRINNANVTQTDIAASNGVVHVIDTVLLPPAN
ncbi:fasciclin domain-containing protein [Deinococcus yavapaiensis]|uniref:Putative surface protein with fasciclin (FAS1) repeats n=1 Tax=Deinococcus yavapaiensis KR-236 TaxID=694435 RepID=A0A318SGI0_9DEIO|nr:fasciclin domain-containing protein [Deinococcus yavapaiensis]PYE56504.1 putative surface protein with fasciclin (FAS1) repeats [Deinococcus yavapaiensis KR-236]